MDDADLVEAETTNIGMRGCEFEDSRKRSCKRITRFEVNSQAVKVVGVFSSSHLFVMLWSAIAGRNGQGTKLADKPLANRHELG